ncbi:MAG: hypothetical protein WAL71_15490 [Terriglobales bacterium]|jgi:hypothetical protein
MAKQHAGVLRRGITILIWGCMAQGALLAQWKPSTWSPFPPLLPPATNFSLTLQEDPYSNLPRGPNCADAAAQKLSCRAFLLTLKNVGSDTVHLDGSGFYRVHVGSLRASGGGAGGMSDLDNSNIRLKPGEIIQRSVRLVPFVNVKQTASGLYFLHAEWVLYGCTDNPPGKGCRYHHAQEPAIVKSAEIMVVTQPDWYTFYQLDW